MTSDDIIHAAADACGVPLSALLSPGRSARLVQARMVAVVLLRDDLAGPAPSWQTIAELLNRKHHNGMAHLYQEAQSRVLTLIAKARRLLESRTNPSAIEMAWWHFFNAMEGIHPSVRNRAIRQLMTAVPISAVETSSLNALTQNLRADHWKNPWLIPA